MCSNLHFIDIHYIDHGSTHILAWMQLVKNYIEFIFQINGTLYADTIWMPTQSWYKSVMTECTPFIINALNNN